MGTIFDLLYVEKVMLKKNHLEVDFQIETFKKIYLKLCLDIYCIWKFWTYISESEISLESWSSLKNFLGGYLKTKFLYVMIFL